MARRFSLRSSSAAFWGSLILIVVYIVWSRSSAFDETFELLFSSLVLIFIYVLVTVFSLVLARQSGDNPMQRWCWLFMSLAAGSTVIAETAWMVLESFLHLEPFPSIADFFYLIYYPLFLVGILLLPYAPMRRHDRSLFGLDLTMIMISGSALVWFFVIGPMYEQSIGVSNLELVAALSYPIGDLVLLMGLVILFQRDVQQIDRAVVALLMASILSQIFPDLAFAYSELHGLPSVTVDRNILWMLAPLFWLGAVARQLNRKQNVPTTVLVQRSTWIRTLRLTLPYAAVATGPILLLVVLDQGIYSGPSVVGLFYVTLVLGVLVLIRQYLVLLENVQLYHQMQRLALVDSLTGVYNRHSFNENLRDEVRRSRDNGRPLSVLLIDVDDFKNYNDSHGHLYGDKVLQKIAEVLSASLRKVDVLARFGGDEFVVLLPETDLQSAQLVADRLEQAVALHDYQGQMLGISLGAAQYQADQTPEDLLEQADRGLYAHKAGKRLRRKDQPELVPDSSPNQEEA